jgi:hypothetical protein
MLIPVIKVQINDRTPSANGVKPIVRSVLWGMVETVVNIDHLNESSNREENDEDFEGSLHIHSDDASASQAKRDYDANFLSASEFTLKSLLEKEIQDSFLEGIIGNVHYLDDDMQLPLSFGKQSKTSNKKKNKKKKVSQTRYGNDPSFECPLGYNWNFELPTPPKHYVEDNVYYLCSPRLEASPPASPSAILNGEQSTASCEALRIVRIVGHGSTLIKNIPLVGSNPGLSSSQYNETETDSETVTVDVVSDCGLVEERLTAPRKHLLKMDEEALFDITEFINSAIYNTPEEDNTHEGAPDENERTYSLLRETARLETHID